MITTIKTEHEMEWITCDHCNDRIYRGMDDEPRSCKICEKHLCDRCGPHDITTFIIVCHKCKEDNDNFIVQLLFNRNRYDRMSATLEADHETTMKNLSKEYQSERDQILRDWGKAVEKI